MLMKLHLGYHNLKRLTITKTFTIIDRRLKMEWYHK